MYNLFVVLADAAPDVVRDGWAATGVLGVLTSILVFVLRWVFLTQLPEKDKQITQLVKDKDEQLRAVLAQHDARTAATEAECRENVRLVVAYLKEEFAKDRAAWEEQSARDRAAFVQMGEKDRALFTQAVAEQQRTNGHVRKTQQQTIELLKGVLARQGWKVGGPAGEGEEDEHAACPDR